MNRKIKVLYIINDLLPGGAQRVVLDIARNLNKEKFDVHTIALRNVKDLEGGEGGDLKKSFEHYNVSYTILGWRKGLHFQEFKQLVEDIKKYSPDIVHLHLPFSIIVGSLASWIAGVKVRIAHEHNTSEFDPWKVRLLKFLTQPLISLTICYTDIIENALFGTRNIFTDIEKEISLSKKNRSITIFNGIDVEMLSSLKSSVDKEKKRLSVDIGQQDIFVLVTGRFVSWKGHEHLIRSFSHVVKERKNIKLRIIGYGPLEEKLKELVFSLNLQNYIRFLSLRTDALELLVSADIFCNVYTYSDQTAVKEALGIAGLEALASGVASIIGFYPSADKFTDNGKNCIYVFPYDEIALKNAILRLADDGEGRKKLSASSVKYMKERFDWSYVAKKYEGVYTFLCN